MSQEVKILSVPVPDPGGDNKQIFLLKAPSDLLGGGIRIIAASAVNGATLNAGTSFSYALHKYGAVSAGGTPAVNGTIAAAIGGTAATFWTSGVPQDFTIDSDYSFLDAGEWLVLDYQEDTNGNPTNSVVNIHYAMGK